MNAELQRNLWLEATPLKLVLPPLIVLMALVVPHYTFNIGQHVAEFLLLVMGIAWGGHRAAGAIPEEVLAGTWDGQRLSAMGPWALGWGKLFGSTLAVWYSMAWVLACALWVGDSRPADLLLVAAGSFFVMALSFLLSLLLLRAAGRRVRAHATVSHSLAATLVLSLGGALPSSGTWYAMLWTDRWLTIFAFLLFGAAAVFGVYRSMREELQMRNLPWALAGFLVLAFGFFSGFAVEQGARLSHSPSFGGDFRAAGPGLAALMVLWWSVPAAFLSNKDPVRLRQWRDLVGAGRLRASLVLTPPWVTALGVGAVLMLVAMVLGWMPAVPALSVLFFTARDVALVLVLTLAARFGRGHAAALVVLVLADGLLPFLLRDVRILSEMVRPSTSIVGALALLAQALVAGWFALRQLRERQPELVLRPAVVTPS